MFKYASFAMVVIGFLCVPVEAQLHGEGDGGRDFHPGLFAQRCVHRVRHTVEFTSRHLHHRTGHCVRTIERLVEAGENEHAQEAAMRCREVLTHIAGRGAMVIEHIAERCVGVLTEHEAPNEVINMVQSAVETALGALQERLDGALARIAAALGDGE